MKNKIVAAKDHVVKHRAKYAAGATAVVLVTGHIHTIGKINVFLKEHDLFDAYYDPDGLFA